MASKFRQEMPPPGGYAQLPFLRYASKPRKLTSAMMLIASAGLMAVGKTVQYFHTSPKIQKARLELIEHEINLAPIIAAEKDRIVLAQLWLNREYEKELMKDVPGWQVGTWYGREAYHNKERFHPLHMTEFAVHDTQQNRYRRQFMGRTKKFIEQPKIEGETMEIIPLDKY